MTYGRPRLAYFWIAGLGLVAGCAQSDPLVQRRTTLGTLKASVSELEFEKDQLRRKVANLEAENRRIDQRLAQSEEENGDLHDRLDDARSLLARHGYELEGKQVSGTAPTPGTGDAEPGTATTRRTKRGSRKVPFAQIPGQLDTPSDRGSDDDDTSGSVPAPRDRFGPQSRVDRPAMQWNPVARQGNDEDAGLR